MAIAAASAPVIDLKAPATYNIRLGDSISKSGESAKSWASVRYNHKPLFTRGTGPTCSIKATGKGSGSELLLEDGVDRYAYAGESTTTESSYVLVLRGDGDDNEAVLERLSGSHAFNLISTPSEKDSGKLRVRYMQLPVGDGQDGAAFGLESEKEEAADADNPFDYRHFLKAAAQPKARRPEVGAPRSGTATPVVQSRAASSTPLPRPVKRAAGSALVQQKMRKALPSTADKANPKRVKAHDERQPPSATQRSATSRPAKAAEAAPKICVDRKASVRRPSYDDSGELILENETPVSEKLPTGQSAMAVALSGQFGQGPISLRSAASSPASHMETPMPTRPAGMDDDGEFEIGVPDSSPEEPSKRPIPRRPGDDEDVDVNEEDEDADVEDLELLSPPTAHKPSVSAAALTDGDEDDLDAQLAAAMAEEEAAPAGVQEDEEESEEE